MMKLALMRKGKPRDASAAEDKIIGITALQIASQIKYNVSVQVTDTSQHQLFRGDCVNQAFLVESLQTNYY